MDHRDDALMQRLLVAFRGEAEERLRAIHSGLLAMENPLSPDKVQALAESLLREAHSLKGAARAVNRADIEMVCQTLEGRLASLKGGQTALTAEFVEGLHLEADRLSQSLRPQPSAPAPSRPEPSTLERTAAAGRENPLWSETVRVPAARLKTLLWQAEEMHGSYLSLRRRLWDLQEMQAAFAEWQRTWAEPRPEGEGRGAGPGPGGEESRPRDLPRADRESVKGLETKLQAVTRKTAEDVRLLGDGASRLLAEMKQALMLPFSSLLEILPKMARDLAQGQGKAVDLAIEGAGLEADRRILEEMKDPLIHLVRNGVDHGIELPQERTVKKKPSRGRIRIAVKPRENDRVELLIEDDGAGIDTGGVRRAAENLGIIGREEGKELTQADLLGLVFRSGLTTRPAPGAISGRGLGLAIVRETVEKLGGAVTLESRPGAGTTFRILLPLTLATFRGIFLRLGEQIFVLPTASVATVVRAGKEEISSAEGRPTVSHQGRVLSLVRLADLLGMTRMAGTEADSAVTAVVLADANPGIAFQVDAVLDEREVLVKGLGPQLARVRHISGATVLGSGRLGLVLSPPDLIQSALKGGVRAAGAASSYTEEEKRRKRILVVEDSITARTLLKNILESAGHRVQTAVDGIDAWTFLKSEDFDLVVSDVDMPRMNGFALTSRIRDEKGLADLPVVLVTALESRDDRERGIEAGANAYIVKSSFDQGNLLEAVERLL